MSGIDPLSIYGKASDQEIVSDSEKRLRSRARASVGRYASLPASLVDELGRLPQEFFPGVGSAPPPNRYKSREDASSLIETFEGMARDAGKANDGPLDKQDCDVKAQALVTASAVSARFASEIVLLCLSMQKVVDDDPERVAHEAILYAHRNKLVPKIPAIREWMNTLFDGLGDKAFPVPGRK